MAREKIKIISFNDSLTVNEKQITDIVTGESSEIFKEIQKTLQKKIITNKIAPAKSHCRNVNILSRRKQKISATVTQNTTPTVQTNSEFKNNDKSRNLVKNRAPHLYIPTTTNLSHLYTHKSYLSAIISPIEKFSDSRGKNCRLLRKTQKRIPTVQIPQISQNTSINFVTNSCKIIKQTMNTSPEINKNKSSTEKQKKTMPSFRLIPISMLGDAEKKILTKIQKPKHFTIKNKNSEISKKFSFLTSQNQKQKGNTSCKIIPVSSLQEAENNILKLMKEAQEKNSDKNTTVTETVDKNIETTTNDESIKRLKFVTEIDIEEIKTEIKEEPEEAENFEFVDVKMDNIEVIQ